MEKADVLKSRTIYLISIIFTIVLGLLSRHIQGVPLFVGDILWATMVYFMLRLLFISKPVRFIILTSLFFCYAVEFSQLYQAPWINSIRHTVIGGLVLGEVFLWGDMLSYTIGIAIAVLAELFFGFLNKEKLTG
ncbi:MAG: DUF2809 domain-containing protein [Candidatus Saccharimonadales bacterium]